MSVGSLNPVVGQMMQLVLSRIICIIHYLATTASVYLSVLKKRSSNFVAVLLTV